MAQSLHSSSAGCRHQLRRGTLVVALFVRACDYRAVFQEFLHQILAAAACAFLGNRPMRRSELALGIISAAVERIPLARAFLNQIALFALGALHANIVLLHVLAFGISAAG